MLKLDMNRELLCICSDKQKNNLESKYLLHLEHAYESVTFPALPRKQPFRWNPHSLHSPHFGATISTASDQILVYETHLLGRLRMSIHDETVVCVCRAVVDFDTVLSSAGYDFSGIKLEGRHGVLVPVRLGHSSGTNVPYLRVSKGKDTKSRSS